MALSRDEMLLEIATVVHAVASTHSFWHANHVQSEVLTRLEGIIETLKEGPVTSPDLTKEITVNV